MAYKLLISRSAQKELDDIVQYMIEKLCNPKAATDFLDVLDEKYEFLTENPKMYPLARDFQLRRRGYRMLKAKNFLVLYRIMEEEQTVFVGGIFYDGEEYWKKIFQSMDE